MSTYYYKTDPVDNEDNAQRREFNITEKSHPFRKKISSSHVIYSAPQTYIHNVQSEATPVQRKLIEWQPGTGKTFGVIGSIMDRVKSYNYRISIGDTVPYTYILGFNVQEIFQNDLLKYPGLGFISAEEQVLLRELKKDPLKAKQHAAHLGNIRKRFKTLGRMKFFGYGEFANRLFKVREGVDLNILLSNKERDDSDLINAVKNGDVVVNYALLDDLKHGYLVCDEIHNAYNSLEINNYGLAIQFMLDWLEDQNASPEVSLLSATPITGAASEIIDLLNILVPKKDRPNNKSLRRNDYFSGKSDLRLGALEKITKLAYGRVSYLLDSDETEYPKQVFVGEKVEGIPYMHFTKCEMSDLHKKTIQHELDTGAGGIPQNAYALFDMVFPPSEKEPDVGLYRTNDVNQFNGIDVNKYGQIKGDFLSRSNIKKYSAKYFKLLEMLDECITKPGKIMIYHHKVRISGVLTISEMLNMDGYIDIHNVPNANTRCVKCGKRNREHSDDSCAFAPARYFLAYGELEKTEMMDHMRQYNDESNRLGDSLKICIGSRVIREGFSFKGIRFQFILSLATDFSIMLQIFGRSNRKLSHEQLERALRDVMTYILLSYDSDKDSPEVQRYKIKGQEFLSIQEILRALNANSIDNFMNYDKIVPSFNTIRTLEYDFKQFPNIGQNQLTFDALGFAEKEVIKIQSTLNQIFYKNRHVAWTYEELWNLIKSGEIVGSYKVQAEDTFALALNNIVTDEYKLTQNLKIVFTGTYYMCIYCDKLNESHVDVNMHLQGIDANNTFIAVNLSEFNKHSRSDRIFRMHLNSLNNVLKSKDDTMITHILIDFPGDFQTSLIRKFIEGEEVTIDDKTMIKLYLRFKIILKSSDVPFAKNKVKGKYVGYISPVLVELYNSAEQKWFGASLSELKNHHAKENDYVIGFMAAVGHKAESIGDERLKLRDPIQKIKKKAQKDNRSIAHGATCITRRRAELLDIILQLKKVLKIKDKFIDKNYCFVVATYLLELEEMSRNNDGERWLYLFNDKQPIISLK